MSLLGKICIVLIFVMSILFMAFSMSVYATHRNYREAIKGSNGLESQLRTAQDQARQKEADNERILTQLQMERAARKESIAVLETRARQFSTQLLKREKDYEELQNKHRQAIATLETAEARMADLKGEVEGLRDSVQTAQKDRDEQFAAVVKLTDTIHENESLVRRLKERNDQLEMQVGRMAKVMRRNGITEFDDVENIPPRLDGIVTVVRDEDLIEISLGSDDGLKKGHALEVFRAAGDYLGRVIITDVSPDRAVGRVVPEYRQGVIRRGDKVATKLI